MAKHKILIVEDDESVRLLLKLYLVRLNFTFIEAKNGLEGIGMARQFKPNLVVTDLNMPIMDGISMIKEIRADVNLKHVPVIVLTGTAKDQQQLASAAGADAVLSKPIQRRDLIEVIESMLHKE